MIGRGGDVTVAEEQSEQRTVDVWLLGVGEENTRQNLS